MVVKFEVTFVKCYGKTFRTDLTCFVDKNSNFTNELKIESETFYFGLFGKFENVSKSFQKFFLESVSHTKQLKLDFC